MHAANPAKSRAHFGHALMLMPRIFPVLEQRLNRFEKTIPPPLGKGLILALILVISSERILAFLFIT
jgi:hypothetical protein